MEYQALEIKVVLAKGVAYVSEAVSGYEVSIELKDQAGYKALYDKIQELSRDGVDEAIQAANEDAQAERLGY